MGMGLYHCSKCKQHFYDHEATAMHIKDKHKGQGEVLRHPTKKELLVKVEQQAALIETLEAKNARLREVIFAGVNLWDRAELSERDENGNQTILLWHPDGVPVLTLKIDSHAPALTPAHIEFVMSDVLDVFMARERARAALEEKNDE